MDCEVEISEGMMCDDCHKNAKAYHPEDCKHLTIQKTRMLNELSEHLHVDSWVNTLEENEIYLKYFFERLMGVLKQERAQLEAWRENPAGRDINELKVKRNKLNRKITSLKKASLKTA